MVSSDPAEWIDWSRGREGVQPKNPIHKYGLRREMSQNGIFEILHKKSIVPRHFLGAINYLN